jgi:hypothetical protein
MACVPWILFGIPVVIFVWWAIATAWPLPGDRWSDILNITLRIDRINPANHVLSAGRFQEEFVDQPA